jgi:hypothetical protein
VLQHRTIRWVNAHGAQGKINRAINVANGVRRNHFALNDCEDPYVERAAVLFGPWLKWDLSTEWPEVRVKEIVELINPRATSHLIKRAA